MLNQMILVGRITEDPVLEEDENGKKIMNVTLAVPRSFKNVDGVYDTDFITVTLYGGVAENTAEYCKKGDLIGAKGRLACLENKLSVVAEKVTFLAGTSK